MQCSICSSLNSHTFTRFSNLKRVTSDAKPWPEGGKLAICCQCGTVQKKVDKIWLDEIALIYNNYEVYHQSAGIEQAIFTKDGKPSKRSQVLTQFLYETRLLSQQKGAILDYGSGNGEFLQSFSKIFPQYDLFGLDLSTRYQSKLESIPGFQKLYHPQSQLEKKFDLVVLSHTLEHLLKPVETLTTIRSYLKPGGGLFIQVPNVKESPFDILIADHLFHFSPESLYNVLYLAGFTVICLRTDVVAKEISLFAVPNLQKSNSRMDINWQEIKLLINQYIKANFQFIADTEQMQRQGEFAIFGTSISATWLYSYFSNVSFFLDEDPSRIGKTHFNKPIYFPKEIYGKTIPISIPLPTAIAEQIISRHFQRQEEFIVPRAIAATNQ